MSIEISEENRSRPRAYEAAAINSYKARDWKKCVYSLNLWHLDQPFNSHPTIVGSSIASDIMGDDKLALSFATSGLQSSPTNSTLYNNAAVSLARMGDVEKAERFSNHAYAFLHPHDIVTRIVLTATKGLIEFRKKKDAAGRALYETALAAALDEKLPRLGIRAYLYLVQEEAYFDPLQAKCALEALDHLSVHMQSEDTKAAMELTVARLKALADAVGGGVASVANSYPCMRLKQVYLPKLATTVQLYLPALAVTG